MSFEEWCRAYGVLSGSPNAHHLYADHRNLEERERWLAKLYWPGILWWPTTWRAHRNLMRLEREFRQVHA
jgi:hypothetical protein